MADQDALRAQVWDAFKAAPKPLTAPQARTIAADILLPADKTLASQFAAWFDKMGDDVVRIING